MQKMALSFSKNTSHRSVNLPESYDSRSAFACTELGCYSIDKERKFHNNDKRELRSLKPNYEQFRGSDLSNGFTRSKGDSFFRNIERPLDSFLRWIVENRAAVVKGDEGNKRLDADFVLIRGTMKRLLATVFNTGDFKTPWKMYAVKYNGTIYISHVEDASVPKGGSTREPKLRCQSRDEEVGKICYMGKQFEEVISEAETQDNAEERQFGDVEAGATVEERQGFYTVSRGTFGGRHLVLTRSEVDCIENGKYLEFKLCLQYTGRDEWKFPMHKLRDWWYHIYAGDIKKIIYGIRDGTGLARLSSLGIDSMPSQIRFPTMSCPPGIKQALSSWNPRSCVGFVDDFLQWLIKEIIMEDAYSGSDPVVQYKLEWKKGWPEVVSCTRLKADECDYVLLPAWFTEKMSSAFQG